MVPDLPNGRPLNLFQYLAQETAIHTSLRSFLTHAFHTELCLQGSLLVADDDQLPKGRNKQYVGDEKEKQSSVPSYCQETTFSSRGFPSASSNDDCSTANCTVINVHSSPHTTFHGLGSHFQWSRHSPCSCGCIGTKGKTLPISLSVLAKGRVENLTSQKLPGHLCPRTEHIGHTEDAAEQTVGDTSTHFLHS